MTLDQFVQKYNGQQITDNSGNYKGECVSLIKRYAQEVQGVSNADSVLYVVNGAAKNMWLAPTPLELQHYDKVSTAQVGDIAVYTNGTYGDVAVYLGNGQVFGQLGTPVFAPAAIRAVGSPTGYLRKKGQNMPTIADRAQVEVLAAVFFEDSIEKNPGLSVYIGQPVENVIAAFKDSPERAAYVKHIADLENGVVTKQAVVDYVNKNLQ